MVPWRCHCPCDPTHESENRETHHFRPAFTPSHAEGVQESHYHCAADQRREEQHCQSFAMVHDAHLSRRCSASGLLTNYDKAR